MDNCRILLLFGFSAKDARASVVVHGCPLQFTRGRHVTKTATTSLPTTSLQHLLAPLPLYVPVKKACEIEGHGRSRLYQKIGAGRYRAIKDGTKTVIETASILADLQSLPEAKIAMDARGRRKGAGA